MTRFSLRHAPSFLMLGAILPGCCAITDPSCGPCEEVSRPFCIEPPCTRTNCADRFSSERWYCQPNCWQPSCAPLRSCYPKRSIPGNTGDVFAVPVDTAILPPPTPPAN